MIEEWNNMEFLASLFIPFMINQKVKIADFFV